jgi:hypothetical protein
MNFHSSQAAGWDTHVSTEEATMVDARRTFGLPPYLLDGKCARSFVLGRRVAQEAASRFLPFENDRSWRIELVLTVDPNGKLPPNSDVFGHVVARIKPP